MNFKMSASLQRPTSKGYIKLKTSNPRDHPEIQPNYMSTEYDRNLMRKSIKIVRHVFAQDGFKPFRGKELAPGKLRILGGRGEVEGIKHEK